MLSDKEIQEVADQHVRPVGRPDHSRLLRHLRGDWAAVWECELHDPPGVYFDIRPRPWLDGDLVRLGGYVGFFVYRATGEVRVFPQNEFSQASQAVGWDQQDLHKVIKRVLTDSDETEQQPGRASRRPWWKFW